MKNKIIIGATGLVLAATLSFAFIQNNDFSGSEFKLAHAEDKTAEGTKTEQESNSEENKEKNKEGGGTGVNGICTNGERNVPVTSKEYKIEWDKDWNGVACDQGDIASSRKTIKPISQSIGENANVKNVTYTPETIAKVGISIKVPAFDNDYLVTSHLKKEHKEVEVSEPTPLDSEVIEESDIYEGFRDLEAVENQSPEVNTNNE